MINKLKFSVQFPTNSVALQQDLTFQPGLTAITGENGVGKTFGSIEMIRYMLFGKKALRGPASDYKSLIGEMDAEIGGIEFNITRNRKTEILKCDGETIAVGAEAVNKRLLDELGFSLDVFDLACAAMQKQSDRLSQMAPTARKKLIDEIVGLTANEAIEKDCKAEANLSEREVEALRSVLREPIKPERPKLYQEASVLQATLNNHVAELAKRVKLKAAARAPALPVEPTCARPDEDVIAEMQVHEATRLEVDAQRRADENELARLKPADYTAEYLDSEDEKTIAIEAYYAAKLRRGEAPIVSIEDIEKMEEIHAEREALARIGATEVMCPDCAHRFCPSTNLPLEPYLTTADLRAQRASHQRHSEPMPAGPDTGPTLAPEEIREQRQRLGNAERIAELRDNIDICQLVDQSEALLQLTAARMQWKSYDTVMEQVQLAVTAAAEAQAELDALPELEDMHVELNDLLVQARVYEAALASFNAASEVYAETSDKIAVAGKRAANFREGAKALAETRKTLKGFLAPSLSRVGSNLISEMTNGKLHSMIVDDEMNITVNGQDIATLNGAGSTAANLALRIGLGQVLVREKFAVFIADEPDADMRPANARATMDCLKSLIGNLKQIFVITHKDADFADHVIEMA